jgi:hypothetical protein
MTMKTDEKLDAYTDSVLRRIDADVLESLSPDQYEAIKEGISAARPYARHPVDWRGVLPLFFARYYFVLLMGRDRRTSTVKKEITRKQKGAFAGGAMFFLVALSPLMVVALVVLYFFKSAAGIDLISDQHAPELIKDLLGL